MSVGIATIIVLLGHVLADFYFQSNKMAQRKNKDSKYLFLHCLQYFLCMIPFMLVVFSWDTVLFAWLIIGGSHALIDVAKVQLAKRNSKSIVYFFADQVSHLLVSAFVVLFMFSGHPILEVVFTLNAVIGEGMTEDILVVTLALFASMRPAGVVVQHILELVRPDKSDGSLSSDVSTQKAGRWIGVLERVIVVVLTLCGELGAIAFVLAAKSIARFKMLDNREFAEYYLVGTLASIATAILVSLAVQNIALWQ